MLLQLLLLVPSLHLEAACAQVLLLMHHHD